MMGEQFKLTSELYPKHFPKIDITEKLEYGLKEFEKIPHYHTEGEVESELCVQPHNWLYIYTSNIYSLTMPNFMMCNETTFRILRNNFANFLLASDDSTTARRLRVRGFEWLEHFVGA